MPDAIHSDAGSEWVRWIDEPTRQIETIRGCRGVTQGREDRQSARVDSVSFSKEIATNQDVGIGWLRVLDEDRDLRGWGDGRFARVGEHNLLQGGSIRIERTMVVGQKRALARRSSIGWDREDFGDFVRQPVQGDGPWSVAQRDPKTADRTGISLFLVERQSQNQPVGGAEFLADLEHGDMPSRSTSAERPAGLGVSIDGPTDVELGRGDV
jgi:hypothetical protein